MANYKFAINTITKRLLQQLLRGMMPTLKGVSGPPKSPNSASFLTRHGLVHAHIDRVPATKAFRQPPPLATLLRHIENRVQRLQIPQTYIAALHWQAIFDAPILLFGDFHPKNSLLPYCFNSVNTDSLGPRRKSRPIRRPANRREPDRQP